MIRDQTSESDDKDPNLKESESESPQFAVIRDPCSIFCYLMSDVCVSGATCPPLTVLNTVVCREMMVNVKRETRHVTRVGVRNFRLRFGFLFYSVIFIPIPDPTLQFHDTLSL